MELEMPTERLIVTVKSPSKIRFNGWLWWYAYRGHITANNYNPGQAKYTNTSGFLTKCS